MIDNKHYLYRMTVLVTLTMLAPYVSEEVVHNMMLPALVDAAKDPVPNVKFNVAKNLQKLMQQSVLEKNAVSEVVQPTLKTLCEDADADVRFFASQALGTCETVLAI